MVSWRKLQRARAIALRSIRSSCASSSVRRALQGTAEQIIFAERRPVDRNQLSGRCRIWVLRLAAKQVRSTGVQKQAVSRPEHFADGITARIGQQLDLAAEQENKFLTVVLAERQVRRVLGFELDVIGMHSAVRKSFGERSKPCGYTAGRPRTAALSGRQTFRLAFPLHDVWRVSLKGRRKKILDRLPEQKGNAK